MKQKSPFLEMIQGCAHPQLVFSQGVIGSGKAFFAEICHQGLEGIPAVQPRKSRIRTSIRILPVCLIRQRPGPGLAREGVTQKTEEIRERHDVVRPRGGDRPSTSRAATSEPCNDSVAIGTSASWSATTTTGETWVGKSPSTSPRPCLAKTSPVRC